MPKKGSAATIQLITVVNCASLANMGSKVTGSALYLQGASPTPFTEMNISDSYSDGPWAVNMYDLDAVVATKFFTANTGSGKGGVGDWIGYDKYPYSFENSNFYNHRGTGGAVNPSVGREVTITGCFFAGNEMDINNRELVTVGNCVFDKEIPAGLAASDGSTITAGARSQNIYVQNELSCSLFPVIPGSDGSGEDSQPPAGGEPSASRSPAFQGSPRIGEQTARIPQTRHGVASRAAGASATGGSAAFAQSRPPETGEVAGTQTAARSNAFAGSSRAAVSAAVSASGKPGASPVSGSGALPGTATIPPTGRGAESAAISASDRAGA
jgi:hypothetical protein